MKVLYANKDIAKIATDKPPPLPYPVIKAARSRIKFLGYAKDERDIRNWKSLHYEKLKGDRDGQRSIRLTDQWRMIITIDSSSSPPEVTIHEICDYH